MIKGTDFISLPVTNLDRAVAFYRDRLGMQPGEVSPGRSTDFEIGPLTLSLIQLEAFGMGFLPAETGMVALGVADVAQTVADLQAHGVGISMPEFDSGVCKMAICSDSEGNTLMLHHRYAPEGGADPAQAAPANGRVTGVDFVSLPVQDLARAIRFYEGTLGLIRSNDQAKRWPEYDMGELTVGLYEPEQIGRPFAPVLTGWVALRVADVAAMVEALKGHGVPIEQPVIDTGVCHMVPVPDSEGNVLLLHHRYAPEP